MAASGGQSNQELSSRLRQLSDAELHELYWKLTRSARVGGVRATPGTSQPSTATDNDEVEIRGVPVRTADLIDLGEQIALLEAYAKYGVPFDTTLVADALSFFEQATGAVPSSRTSPDRAGRLSEYQQVRDEIAAAIRAIVEKRLAGDEGQGVPEGT